MSKEHLTEGERWNRFWSLGPGDTIVQAVNTRCTKPVAQAILGHLYRDNEPNWQVCKHDIMELSHGLNSLIAELHSKGMM